ncbi:MAG: flippase-like domain-containing protein [Firmicutes bacterium]|nr:flippase-like domain-containing protein [Bacillota bacterium]
MGQKQQANPASLSRFARGAFAGIGLSLLGLYAILRLTENPHSWTEIVAIKPSMLILACGLMLLIRCIDAVRMKLLTCSLGGSLSLVKAIRISILGVFGANITPFSSAGGPTQVYLLAENGLNVGQSTAVVATNTLCNTFSRFTLGTAASVWLFYFPESWAIPKAMHIVLIIGILLYCAMLTISLYLIIYPDKIKVLIVPVVSNKFTLRFARPDQIDALLGRIDGEIREFRKALVALLKQKRATLWIVIMLSYVWWAAVTMVPAVILVGLGMEPSLLEVMAITLVFYLGASYAPTPGSSGVAELGFGLLFSSMVPHSLIGLFVAIWRGFTYYLNLIAGGTLMAIEIMRRGPLLGKTGIDSK